MLYEVITGVEIDALNENGMTALALVSTSANIDMMKLLLENGADVNHSSSGKNSGISPLHGAGLGHALSGGGNEPDGNQLPDRHGHGGPPAHQSAAHPP